MKQKTSFTLETVISSPDKVQLLEQAQQLGCRTYRYFIATDDPAISNSRVRNRVKQGGVLNDIGTSSVFWRVNNGPMQSELAFIAGNTGDRPKRDRDFRLNIKRKADFRLTLALVRNIEALSA